MGTYAICGMAGSTGKTTTIVSLGTQLALDGVRVRIIDIDSQANASTWLGYDDTHFKTVADVLRKNASIADVELPARVMQGYDAQDNEVFQEIPNLTVVPARRATLDKLLIELPAITGGVLHLREALEEADDVDVTLIDCPGTMNALVVSGVLATTIDEADSRRGAWGVITATRPSGKEMDGIPVLQKELSDINRAYRVGVPLLAIVPCAVPGKNRGLMYQEQMADLREEYGELITPGVRLTTAVDEAYTNATPVPLYGHRAKDVIADYRAVQEYMEKSLKVFPRKAMVA